MNSTGTTLSWAMDDDHSKAVAAVQVERLPSDSVFTYYMFDGAIQRTPHRAQVCESCASARYRSLMRALYSQEVLSDSVTHLIAKTTVMNGLLNSVVPYFRCSDQVGGWWGGRVDDAIYIICSST